MKPHRALLGVRDKLAAMKTQCEEFKFDVADIAYIGDDVMDIPAMEAAGISFCPNNSIISVTEAADVVCYMESGEGVLSEVVDGLLVAEHDIKGYSITRCGNIIYVNRETY